MYEFDYCPQCGEPTEIFRDGLCSDCSIANQQELDLHFESEERWASLSIDQRNGMIRQAIDLANIPDQEREGSPYVRVPRVLETDSSDDDCDDQDESSECVSLYTDEDEGPSLLDF